MSVTVWKGRTVGFSVVSSGPKRNTNYLARSRMDETIVRVFWDIEGLALSARKQEGMDTKHKVYLFSIGQAQYIVLSYTYNSIRLPLLPTPKSSYYTPPTSRSSALLLIDGSPMDLATRCRVVIVSAEAADPFDRSLLTLVVECHHIFPYCLTSPEPGEMRQQPHVVSSSGYPSHPTRNRALTSLSLNQSGDRERVLEEAMAAIAAEDGRPATVAADARDE
ncbi:hypothetical protein K440DRAFT_663950 [Wilcoxina mikolae CBS 423.85]|nr:hypothetical protein K440DRAFT_663950 [Wilcoxina mikolae CBS 423.85]